MALRIAGTGHFVPERILTNQDLEKMVDTSDEWIRTRTGIEIRHIADPSVPTSEMCIPAAKAALENAGVSPSEIQFIIVATVTPDYMFPSTACLLQNALGVPQSSTCFDIHAACSGLIYSMEIASSLIDSKKYQCGLILGAEKLSCIVDWKDRSTCVLFGDAASAAVLKNDPDTKESSVLASVMYSDGAHTDILSLPAGGSKNPATHETVDGKMHFLKMGGPEVFKLAINDMVTASRTALEKAGVTVDQLRWVIPHQANKRIIDMVARRLDARPEQVYVNVDRYGNTSAASIGLCLDDLVRSGQLNRGDLILLTSFGAGMTWGAVLIRW